ncbi:hypothetical protein ABPG74_001483 [Tetrahymena malaccensis]
MPNLQISANFGTPPVDQKLQFLLGKREESAIGQFLFDSSIKDNNQQYYQQSLQYLTLYDMRQSSTAKIDPQQIQSGNFYYGNGGNISGNKVTDIIEIGNVKFNYTFLCATQVTQLNFMFNSNGILYLNRYQDSLFDLMYQQNKIKTSDYIVKILKQKQQGMMSSYKMNLHFDLDKDSDYYNYPSNPMIKGDQFKIMAYGVYVNGQDVSDKLKHFKINFDLQLNSLGVGIPTDLYNMITKDQGYFQPFIQNCPNCECPQTKDLPSFKVITQEYAFEITPDMYLIKQQQQQIDQPNSFQNSDCQIGLLSMGEQFNFQQGFQDITQTPIMYQKATNSLKFIGVQTMQHMNITVLIITLSCLNFLVLISLIYFAFLFVKEFTLYKMEQIQLLKKKRKQ